MNIVILTLTLFVLFLICLIKRSSNPYQFGGGGYRELVALPPDETYTTQYLYPNGYWPLYYFNKYNYFPGPPYNYGCPTCFDAPFI